MTPVQQFERDHNFQSEVLHAIGRMKLIASGKITRGRRKNHRDWEPGLRPLTMADAKAIAGLAAERLTNALNAFMESAPKYADWRVYETQFISVHKEPDDFTKWVSENCVDCKNPTRYWMQDRHTPLCPECCIKRNAAMEKEEDDFKAKVKAGVFQRKLRK